MNYRVAVRNRVAHNLHTAAFISNELGRNGEALTRAAEEILLALSDNPTELGESRAGNERVYIVHPLAVIYEVFEAAQVVMIYEAIYHPRRRL